MAEAAVKEAQTVITSENRAEFMAKRLDLVRTEPVEAPSDDSVAEEPIVESDGPQETEAEAQATEQETKPPKIEKRFSDVSKARKAAEDAAAAAIAEAKAEREARVKFETEAAELRAKYEPPKAELDPEPQPQQFTDVGEYAKALKEWTIEAANRDRDIAEAQKRLETTWKARVEDTRKDAPDYDQVMAATDVKVSNEMRDAIRESDIGPKLAYHLAKNPEVALRLGQLSVPSMLREVGKLEAKLAETPKSAPAAEVSVAEISKAPPPINPLKGANSPVDSPVNTAGEFVGTYAQWKAARKAGKIR